jgi:predicted amidohydrolase YtcJ
MTFIKSIYKYKLLFIFLLFSYCDSSKIDLLVHNAIVYTVDDYGSISTSFAVNDGKFIAVGGEEILDKYSAKNIVDAKGLPIYPGFIDSHCHFLSLGLKEDQLDLVGTNSYDEVINKVKEYSEKNKKDFIIGRGWDQNDWKNKSLPTKEKLDVLFPETPVILKRIDGHAMLVNQKALDLAEISSIDVKVDGGEIVLKNNKITGVLIDSAMDFIKKIIPEKSLDDKINALLKAEEICFANGLTTVDDAGLNKEEILLIDSLQSKGILQMRVYAMISNEKESVDYFINRGPIKTDLLNVRSVKVYADGALGSRGAALKKPYSDRKGYKGTLITPIDSIESLAYRLAQAKFQMNTHAIGDASISYVLNAYKKALVFSEDPRWRIEHVQIIDTSDIKLFNKKIIPSVQPTHATSDMYWVKDRIGASRMNGAYSYKKLLKEAGLIALGTDSPVENINPILTFYAAVFRRDLNDYPENGFNFNNALSREEALKGMTIWAAKANFEEKEKGSIEAGKKADFVILDRDIMEETGKRIISTKVVATIINGEIVYSNRFK